MAICWNKTEPSSWEFLFSTMDSLLPESHVLPFLSLLLSFDGVYYILQLFSVKEGLEFLMSDLFEVYLQAEKFTLFSYTIQ